MLTFNLSGYFVEYRLEHCHETGVLSQSCSNEKCSFIFKVLFCNKEQQLMTASNSFFSPSCKSSITLKALKIGHSVETEVSITTSPLSHVQRQEGGVCRG